MNKVSILGRIVKDPDLRFIGGTGKAVSSFTVAVNRQYKKDEADFINCIAFGKQAETIAEYMQKGSQIALNGNIRTGSYEAKDGSKRYTTDVVIENFEFVGGNNSNSRNKGSNSNNIHGGSNNGFDDQMTPVDDGDLPF